MMLPTNNRPAPHSNIGSSKKKPLNRSSNLWQTTTGDDIVASLEPWETQELEAGSMQPSQPTIAQPMQEYPDHGRILDMFLQNTVSAELEQQRQHLSYQLTMDSTYLHSNNRQAASLAHRFGVMSGASGQGFPFATAETSTFTQTAAARLPVQQQTFAATHPVTMPYTDYEPVPLNQAPVAPPDGSVFGAFPALNSSIEDSKPSFQPIETSDHQRVCLPKTKTFPSERANLEISNVTSSTAEASRVLLLLGSTLRSKADKFIDASVITDPGGNMRRATGKELFFPDRLYRMLEYAEKEGLTDIVSFQPHGRSFRVHNKHMFVEKLLPLCLKGQSSWPSFLRQLRLYGFSRAETGPDYGAYYHELFLRSRPGLCRYMRRVGAPHGGLDRRTFKLSEGQDPDFYNHSRFAPMPALELPSAGIEFEI